MRVAIVKYNAGNIASVANSLSRLGVEATITDDAQELRNSERVIFPGVGEASSAMKYLRERHLDEVIVSLTQPVLGICLGMQLLCMSSEENDTECLGLLPYRVRRFADGSLKVPHVGWNRITSFQGSLFERVEAGAYVYFVHGYFVEEGDETSARCDYGVGFSAAIQTQNFHAVQFHPERSGTVGERILENFLSI